MAHLVHHIRVENKDTRQHFVFLDGHYSHFSSQALQMAADAGIHVIFLPSHMSARMQPADTGLNALFKKLIAHCYHELMSQMDELEMNQAFINWVRARAGAGSAVTLVYALPRALQHLTCALSSTPHADNRTGVAAVPAAVRAGIAARLGARGPVAAAGARGRGAHRG